ncbi:hypothetical protein [Helcobacillus massiliensis]|uniref:hypothetical protein n=1 Tax=Helcobacillus massiliensis TaxID=521392 RepID=UPI0025526587|nr:hypothetical protein [Helcobacillus massiliensis]MDK7741285.1 hypothetical protein [Helcobacillus massiliensis]WOO92863.1 hypothetical protein R3I40_10730 [Helcobacillus massiliensis]
MYDLAMSVMEHRLQLLLDAQRLDQLRERAAEQGTSVSAVVRDAIDASFATDAVEVRAQAARELLALTASNDDSEPPVAAGEVESVRDEMDAELIAKADRW